MFYIHSDEIFLQVLTMLINSAYKPGRVLRELQVVEDPLWNCQEETLKAKYEHTPTISNGLSFVYIMLCYLWE